MGNFKKKLRDFIKGKPHSERRLGDLYMDKTGLYKHREWRGIKDTMYYFNRIWLYNYGMMVYDIMRYGHTLCQGRVALPLDRPDLSHRHALVRPRL